MVSKQTLLNVLPPFTNESILIERRQDVHDIVKEVCEAHKYFAEDYNRIAKYFDGPDITAICKSLFNFCKLNIRYKVEGEDSQTTKSPAAIIALGDSVGGDCKHFAGMIGGVLAALERRGKKVYWFYRFASYRMFDSTPQHVFVVVDINGKEIWIDPVLKNFNERLEPTFKPLDKKIVMPLYRISGTDDSLEESNDSETSPEIINAIRRLYSYGLISEDGLFSESALAQLAVTLPAWEYEEVFGLYQFLLSQTTVGSVFGDLWNGFKTVTLVAPRAAFLSLVALNVFGYASKLNRAISTDEGKNKIRAKWTGLGGKMSAIENAINAGKGKRAFLGDVPDIIGEPVSIAAITAAASAIVAAIMPLVKEILNKMPAQGPGDGGEDPFPYGICPDGSAKREDGSCINKARPMGVLEFIQKNPLIIIAGIAGAVYFFTRKKSKA